ncbi:MAG: MATE family efflux transporter [Cetobacterium sp.]|uniref:MATE family efflux transporter n=1 Tax=Cetobacterium sp. TaxID=2071632 RepID=UPI002FCA9D2F
MSTNLSKENIPKLLLKYCLPSVLTMWIFSLYSIVDGFFIGKYLGSKGLAAVNIVMPYINLSFAMGIMIAIGGSTIIGIKLGEKDEESANKVFSISVQLFILFGTIIGFIGIFFTEDVVRLLGANDTILNDSKTYLFYLSFFIISYLLGYGLEIFIRVDGAPSFSLICIIVGALVNIILDYIFIGKLSLGIKGAAIATGIGQLSTVIPLIYYLKFKRKKLKFKLSKINLKLCNSILFNGSSEFLTEIATGIVIMAFNINIMKLIGEKGVSSFGIIGYISTLVTMTMIGFAQGIQPIISYNFGALKFKRIKTVLNYSLVIILILGGIFYLLVNLFTHNIIKIFVSNNINLYNLTHEAIKLYSFTYLIMGLNIIVSAYFTAIEEALISCGLSILRGLLFINVALLVLPIFFNTKGIWLSAPINELFTLLFSITLLFTVGYKKIIPNNIKNEDKEYNIL